MEPFSFFIYFDVNFFTWEIYMLKGVITVLISFNKYSQPILPPWTRRHSHASLDGSRPVCKCTSLNGLKKKMHEKKVHGHGLPPRRRGTRAAEPPVCSASLRRPCAPPRRKAPRRLGHVSNLLKNIINFCNPPIPRELKPSHPPIPATQPLTSSMLSGC